MNRREFLKFIGRTGIATAGSLIIPGLYQSTEASSKKYNKDYIKREILKKELKNLDPLTKKIIEIESNWRYWAIGKSRDIGLMQITSPVLEEWNQNNKKKYSHEELFHPFKNIEVGEWYLHKRIGEHYLPHYNIPVTEENKAASYNAGPPLIGRIGDASKNFDKLPKKTQNYLTKLRRLNQKI